MARAKPASLSQRSSYFFSRRFSELRGFLWWGAAAFLTAALLSFSPADPSLNQATESSVHNLAGYPGAVLADFMIQTFGISSVLMVLAFMAWGWRLISTHQNNRLWLRLTALCMILPIASYLINFITPPASWPIDTGLGGAVGSLLGRRISSVASPPLLGLCAFIALVGLVPLALGLTRREWARLFRFMALGSLVTTSFVKRIIRPFRRSEGPGFTSYPDAIRPASLMARLTSFFSRSDEEYEEDEADEAPRIDKKSRTAPSLKPVAKIMGNQAANANTDHTAEEKQSPRVVTAPRKAEKQEELHFKRDTGDFQLPDLELLKSSPKVKKKANSETALEQNARLLESVLHDFGVKGEIIGIHPGPVVTLYELEPSPGTKSSRVIGLADDIARSMSAVSARISVIPGRNALGIELPNAKRETVLLRELLEDDSFSKSDCKLPLALGKDIGGEPIVVDLARMPHLLVAGTTGSGKSVSVNAMIASLLYHLSPDECKFIMIDPKMLELSVYEGIPHLLSPVVTEPGKAVVALKWVTKEMENRYRLMANLGVRNIDGYNKRIQAARDKGEALKRTVQTGFDPETGKPIYEDQPLDMNALPFIVVVVDEMADLMLVAGKDIETSIQRLAQMARAAGIHIVMATQRPSVDVITGVIKANFPTRISFQVTSRIDSRTILGEQGAEQLLGMGDMLYMAGGGRITRIHGPFVSDAEIDGIVSYLKTQGEPNYVEEVTLDPEESDEFFEGDASDEDQLLYQKAVSIVRRDGKASTSYIQRCLKIGYNRAARLIEQMEREGIVSQATATGKREVLAS